MKTKYDNTPARICQIRSMDISNGEGIGCAAFFGGCSILCPNCFNVQLQNFDVGEIYTKEHEDKIIELMKPDYIVRLSILGGEPFIYRNYEHILSLVKRVKTTYPNKKIWMYSGQYYEDLNDSKWHEVLKYVDVLCDGPYIDEQRDPNNLKWVGSHNQRVIDIEDTLADANCCIHHHKDK